MNEIVFTQTMSRRSKRIQPMQEAVEHILAKSDKHGLVVRYIDKLKGM